jgi:phage host-nuclease inhibitor protein Gam
MPKKTPIEITRDAAEIAMGALAHATHQRDKLVAQLNDKLTEVRERFEPSIADLTAAIAAHDKTLRDFADTHPEEFDRAKSLKLVHGVIGYRLGNYALKTVKGITWARALNLIRDRMPIYIRTKQEVDKEAILADRQKLTPNELARIGCRIEQAESFFAEPEKDTPPS